LTDIAAHIWIATAYATLSVAGSADDRPQRRSCSTDALTAKQVNGGGFAGHALAVIQVVNRSSAACSLSGFPSLRATALRRTPPNISFNDEPNNALWHSDQNAALTLAPLSGAVGFYLGVTRDPNTPCGAWMASALNLRAPGDHSLSVSKFVPVLRFCVGSEVSVSPFVRGPTSLPQ
jgi:hypothetical protein